MTTPSPHADELMALYAELDQIDALTKMDRVINGHGEQPEWSVFDAWIERKVKIIERIVALTGHVTLMGPPDVET